MFKKVAWLVVTGLPWLTMNAIAHHSPVANFHLDQTVEVEGVVKSTRFANPHYQIVLTVPTDSGEEQEWQVEGGTMNDLVRQGFDRQSVPPGTPLRIVGSPAR